MGQKLQYIFEKYLRIIRWIVIILVLAVIFISSAKIIKSNLAKGDIEAYLHAASLILKQENIYATPSRDVTQGGVYYLYLPLLAILFIPLTFVPVQAAAIFWTVLNVFFIFWTVKVFYETISGKAFFSIPVTERWILSFFPLLLTSRFILYHLSYAQANILLVCLVVWGLKLTSARRETLGGFLIGIAIVIKTIAAPFLVWFVAKRDFRTLLGITIGIIVGAILIPSLVFGFAKNWEYINFWINNIVRADDLRTSKVPLGMNVSLQALFYRLFDNVEAYSYNGSPVYLTVTLLSAETIKLLGKAVQVISLFSIVFYAFRHRKSMEIVAKWGGVALTFVMIPLFAPTTQKHYFVVLLPAYLYVVYVWYSLKLKDYWFRILIIGSFIFATLTVDGIVGKSLNDFFDASGFITYGTILLALAIFRAASCLEKSQIITTAAEQI